MRRAAKVDDNHAAIRDALRAAGAWVRSTAALGNGFPDLLVFFRSRFTLLEVKRLGPPSKARLTPAEEKFLADCPGPLYVVRTPEEALFAVGAITVPPLTLVATTVARWETDRARRNGGGA